MKRWRIRIVELVDDLLADVITHQQFSEAMPDEAFDDAEADELIDMILHEPRIGWFSGVSKEQGRKNREEILRLLGELQRTAGDEEVQ